jgi:shikimate kinase
MKSDFLSKPVFLCGMMGSGKSTLGEELAQELSVPFYDLDKLIEDDQGKSIPEIFKTDGEAIFRTVEEKLLIQYSKSVKGILALGGGSLQNQSLVDYLKLNGWLIFLDTPQSVLSKRLENSRGRPLISAGNLNESIEQKIKKLLAARRPFYSQAHITIKTDGLSKKQITELIKKKLALYEQKNH